MTAGCSCGRRGRPALKKSLLFLEEREACFFSSLHLDLFDFESQNRERKMKMKTRSSSREAGAAPPVVKKMAQSLNEITEMQRITAVNSTVLAEHIKSMETTLESTHSLVDYLQTDYLKRRDAELILTKTENG